MSSSSEQSGTGTEAGLACDWWRIAEDDFDLMATMGHTTHRLSVEWSRIEPEDGVFDARAVARYRELLKGLRQRGIEPMVTLFHFTTPLWLTRQGGWCSRASVVRFRRYARHAVEQFGDLVKLWCPVNEPNVYASLGYLFGEHAPGTRSLPLCFRVLGHLLRAHGAAYRIIHALDGSAKVGLAKSMQVFDPLDAASRASVQVARLLDRLVNGLSLQAVGDGRLGFPVGLGLGVHGPLVDSTDLFGVNYYNRRRVGLHGGRGGRLPMLHTTPGAEVSDSGRNGTYGEVYPAGLYRVLKRVAALGKPVYVTENGLPDADDSKRPRFIPTYLSQVQRAITEGVDVRGYYHWSFIDNFEWSEGWSLRFGLVALNPSTQARNPRPSAHVYSEIINANAVSQKPVATHAPEVLSDIFPQAVGRHDGAVPGNQFQEQA